MCFSADASFGAAACLFPMGLYSLRQAIRIRPSFVPFALTPIAFGLQQLAEAFVWRGLISSPPRSVAGPAAVFLFFAIAWWPFWFPLCAAFAAPTPQRRLPFVLFTILSTFWFVRGYLPAHDDPGQYLTATVVRHSIRYPYTDQILLGQGNRLAITSLYMFFTACPLMLLSPRVFLGPVLLAIGSAILSTIMVVYAFTSVWCFFAAMLSAWCTFFFHGLKTPRLPAIATESIP
ncbi:hypothetical protein GC170_04215 [bacterium]|nr:hypothetical protein [bacterium]